jgi:hypothetical protein
MILFKYFSKPVSIFLVHFKKENWPLVILRIGPHHVGMGWDRPIFWPIAAQCLSDRAPLSIQLYRQPHPPPTAEEVRQLPPVFENLMGIKKFGGKRIRRIL